MLKIPDHTPNKQRGHGYRGQRCSGAATQGSGLRSGILCGRFAIIQFICHPIPVEEVENEAMVSFRGASFYTL